MAPISISGRIQGTEVPDTAALEDGLPGVTLAFPNGLRAHFGRGGEKVLMEVLTQSLCSHVLP